MSDPPLQSESAPGELSLVAAEVDGGVEFLDEALDHWLIRVSPIELDVPVVETSPALAAVVQQLALQFPRITELAKAPGGLQVDFSPEIRRLLTSGQAHLMRSGDELIPIAVDQSGRIVGHANVVGSASVATTGVVATGMVASISWPVLLVAAVGAAAAWSEHRWLERTFGDMQAGLSRIEHRLRDDDHGALDAADAVVALVRPHLLDGRIPDQLRYELSTARHDVERIYRSRHRFVTRFKAELEQSQIAHELAGGAKTPWVGDIASDLANSKTGLVDELVSYVMAMISRANIGACTASVLAADGDGRAALNLLDQLQDSTRTDYWDLQNRLAALARVEPGSGFWAKVPLLPKSVTAAMPKSSKPAQAHAVVSALASEMEVKIGSAVPDRDEITSIVVSTGALSLAS